MVDKRIYPVIGIVLLVIVLQLSQTPQKEVIQQTSITIPQTVNFWGDDVSDLTHLLVETEDFDRTPEILNIADFIKLSSSSSIDSIKKTLTYVNRNINYRPDVEIDYCYNEKASDVLEIGYGDCVSMTRLTVSLLRAQNIPTRSVGGCLDLQRTCGLIFAISPFETVPKPVSVDPDDFKKRGFLHEWAEAWTPGTGWILLETTAGRIYSTDCDSYNIHSYDNNRFNRCIISDREFINTCRKV